MINFNSTYLYMCTFNKCFVGFFKLLILFDYLFILFFYIFLFYFILFIYFFFFFFFFWGGGIGIIINNNQGLYTKMLAKNIQNTQKELHENYNKSYT